MNNNSACSTSDENASKLMNKYKIVGTQEQIQAISHACNTMARLEIAQIRALIDVLPLKETCNRHELLAKIEDLLKPHIKEVLVNSDYFPMYQSIRHRLSWDENPNGGWTVNYDEAMPLNNKPLLSVTKLEKKRLSQDIFEGQPSNIKSAHIDLNGVAFLNECTIANLKVFDAQHICMTEGLWQHPFGKGYNTDGWENSPINREQ